MAVPSTTTCPACGFPTFADNACSRCGYVSGAGNTCPSCGSVARVEGTGKAAVCAVCGAPRIPGGFGGDPAKDALRETKAHRSAATRSSAATIVFAILAGIMTLLALAILPASLAGKAIVIALAVLPVVLALRSRSKTMKARNKAQEAQERAWLAAAEEIALRSGKGVTPAELAKRLGLDVAEADKLLTTLAVHDRTRIDVGDDAEVRYSVTPDVAVRVADPTDVDARAEAEIENEPAKEALKR
jgi:hypothetical protein